MAQPPLTRIAFDDLDSLPSSSMSNHGKVYSEGMMKIARVSRGACVAQGRPGARGLTHALLFYFRVTSLFMTGTIDADELERALSDFRKHIKPLLGTQSPKPFLTYSWT